MKHTYLSQEKILKALEKKQITYREAVELEDILARCKDKF